MILKFADICKSYSKTTIALDHVSFSVPPGQVCVVLGSSGAGKSTLLKLVNGLVVGTEGRVEFDGVDVTAKSLPHIRPRIGMVHQQFNLVPRLSVLNNVLAGALPRVSTLRALSGVFPERIRRRACRLLSEVGLGEEHLYRRAMTLSGGQQQRVAIARAFILEPQLVLADEPVASLDPETSRNILTLLRDASRQHGATVLCSLHQVELAREFADHVIAMKNGQIVFSGPPSDFSDQVRYAVYGGQAATSDVSTCDGPATGEFERNA
ncbi:MAG: phosphonate ABC transporter ATP-binding protein [Planctomycetaceae bacterium]